MNSNVLAVTDAVAVSNAKCDAIIANLDNIIARMEAQVYRWKTEASWVDVKHIIDDVERGKFCEPDTTTIEYYNNDRIYVQAEVDSDYYPIKLEVMLIDDEGDEYPLCDEQYKPIYNAWEKALREADEDARSEAEFNEYLWRACV